MRPDLVDSRPAEILRLVGQGCTGAAAAAQVGINRKTVARWKRDLHGFGDAYTRAMQLCHDRSDKARDELAKLVAAWTPGGLLEPGPGIDPLEREPEWVRERVRAVMASALGIPVADSAPVRADPEVIEPDVLDAAGAELTVSGSRPTLPAAPYTKVRPPTRDEWLAEMAALARDPEQPERVRVTAIAAVSSGLFGGPGGRSTRPADLDDVAVAAAARRGRDPGVPASVWQEARRSFLGPSPAEANADDGKGGDVVELEQATPG